MVYEGGQAIGSTEPRLGDEASLQNRVWDKIAQFLSRDPDQISPTEDFPLPDAETVPLLPAIRKDPDG